MLICFRDYVNLFLQELTFSKSFSTRITRILQINADFKLFKMSVLQIEM
jgi:hypothetical protein